jgi:putative transcriptional regulator
MTLPTLAAKLRRLREHLKMARPEFAELLGIPPTTLKNYENGYREAIPASVIITLANTESIANYVPYLLNNSAAVDTLGVMDKEPE